MTGGAGVALMGLAALFGLQKPVDVNALPAPTNATPVSRSAEADALDETVRNFVRARIEVGKGRYFRVARGTSWQMVTKLLAEQTPMQGRAKRVRLGWERPGLDLIDLYDLGRRKGVAVAMRNDLVGYYPIAFISK